MTAVTEYELLAADPQLDPRLDEFHRDALESLGFTVVSIGINEGLQSVGERMGFSVGINPWPKPSVEDNSMPCEGITDFAETLGVPNQNLLTIYPNNHTNKVIVIDDPSQQTVYIADEGRCVPYEIAEEDPFFDGVIVIKNEKTKDMVLSLTGSDCTSIVGYGKTADGQELIFGIHAGRKGCLSGVIENTFVKLRLMGVDFSTLELTIGPGAHAIEIPASLIYEESLLNKHEQKPKTAAELLGKSVISLYPDSDDELCLKALYDHQLDVAYHVDSTFGQSGSKINVVADNTLTHPLLKSHRMSSIARRLNDTKTVVGKEGRNMTFVRFGE